MDSYEEIYTNTQLENIISEFSRIKDNCYLDHVGATLYSDIQLQNVFKDFTNNLYGNPHSFNISSKFTGDAIDQIRYQILDFFNTTPEEYTVIFTSGATAALKIVAETFDYKNGIFAYLEDNHTSAVGMREYAKYKIIKHDEAFSIFNNNINADNEHYENNSLFVYPAQCNFSGTKYPLSWVKKVQNGSLNYLEKSNWYCFLDAASFVSTNKLDLKKYQPDFVCLSFYKIFGYPTGLGALLVKNTSENVIKKRYFGGGTVQVTLPKEYVFRNLLHERFEDGTLPFLSILSLRHGFETLKRLDLTMDLISKHTFSLAKYVFYNLLFMHHSNGKPVAVLYHDSDFENIKYQGSIVNFNLLRANGEYIGYSEVLNLANLYKIHFRTGCFCNPGSCQRHLQLSPELVKHHFISGHICGDQNDLIDNYPTGSVRISFGYMSTKKDADVFLQMITECFVSKPVIKKIPTNWVTCKNEYNKKFNIFNHIETNFEEKKSKPIADVVSSDISDKVFKQEFIGEIEKIFLYPVKSCAAFSVSKWRIEENGLQFDREWMIVTSAGVCLSQKNEPKLCLIKPSIDLEENLLKLNFLDNSSIAIPLNMDVKKQSEMSLCQSKVCGDRVKCYDCGNEVADWLNDCLLRSDLRLVRQSSVDSRVTKKGESSHLSLVNQAQYLLLNIASVKDLASKIPDFEMTDDNINNLVSRFRANFIVNSEEAYVENNCQNIEIGNFKFQCVGPCTRCQMICIDQTTGEKNVEPLRTLSAEMKGKIKFGVYLTKYYKNEDTIYLNEKVLFK